MSNLQKQIIEEALHLSILERADIVDILLKSIDSPDNDIDQAWAEEAEKRVDFYQEKRKSLISSAKIFERYGL